MWLSDSFDIPRELIHNPPSPEFRQFLLNWFGSNAVNRSEKVRSATCLVPEELALARELMRRNLKTRYGRIINGTWILGDSEAIPILREMFGNETDAGRRLTIAGALWKLCKDPVFIDCLNRAKGTSLMVPHMDQVLWLDDERAIDFLIDLLPTKNDDPWWRRILRARAATRDAGRWALGILNRLEAGGFADPQDQHPPSHYHELRNDSDFRERMMQAVHKMSVELPLDM